MHILSYWKEYCIDQNFYSIIKPFKSALKIFSLPLSFFPKNGYSTDKIGIMIQKNDHSTDLCINYTISYDDWY